MNQRFLSKFLIIVVLVVLIWNAVFTLLASFHDKNALDVHILQQVAGWGELLLAIILFAVLVKLIKRDRLFF